MFSHVMLRVDDVLAAKAFYDVVLGTLGIDEGVIDEWGRVVYSTDAGRFLITKPINGRPATFANGATIGFLAKTADEVHAWHAAELASGGSAIEDPPGERQVTGRRVLHLAYLRDPAGNKVCATHRAS